MAKRKGEEETIGDVLKSFISSSKLEKGLDKVAAADAWAEVMGETIQKYTTQVTLDRDTLYVQLSSSVLREELSYGLEKIKTLINDHLEKELIQKIVLR